MERPTDDSVAINNVSNARRTQPEPAFNIVQPAYLPRSIAPKVERSSAASSKRFTLSTLSVLIPIQTFERRRRYNSTLRELSRHSS